MIALQKTREIVKGKMVTKQSNVAFYHGINYILYDFRVIFYNALITEFFQNYLLDSNSDLLNIFELFSYIYQHYSADLRNSTNMMLMGTLHKINIDPVFYNYAIFNADKLCSLLDQLHSPILHISSGIFQEFKSCCLYIGKGSSLRKHQHIFDARKTANDVSIKPTINGKRIRDLWENEIGICLFHFPIEINHYEAHSREYAMIKAVGLQHLNNVNNGTAYGCMKTWNENEVKNFGNMLLYHALHIFIHEKPNVINH